MKIATFLFMLAFLFSCNEKAKEKETQLSEANPTESAELSTVEVGSEAKAHINKILNQYYELNDALVAEDADEAKTAGQKLSEIIGSFDVESLQDDVIAGFKEFSEKIRQDAQQISEEEDIEVQRQHFASITDGLYDMIKTYDANEEAVYYTYCPMAFDDNGGYWLSKDKEISNPYFGSKMLTCGSVKETIAEN